MQSWASVWDTLRRKEGKEKKGHLAIECDWERNTLSKGWSSVCELHRVSKNTKRYLAIWGAVHVKRYRETQWECKRVEKKKVTFFFAQVTHKEDKLVEFSWSFWVLQLWRVGVFKERFCYWLCGEIVFTHWDLFVVYPIYCELKFSINLIIVISIL